MADKRKKKSFWKKPEGITGILFLLALLAGVGFLVSGSIAAIIAFASTPPGLYITLGVLGLVIFTALDGKARSLISYMYKSVMRGITGFFIEMDPISILKNYVEDLKKNLKKMNKQIVQLRGQMHKLKEMIYNNKKQINTNLEMATKAKSANKKSVVILKTRKAGRLKESNMKLDQLYNKMEILYRVLEKMYENSGILMEDIEDQVQIKDQERKAIMAGHGAMKSAMDIIKGNSDKREMFDRALESIADDVSEKVGEMERFMDMSSDFMDSIDLQNGVFEEEGLKMLEKWEKQSDSLLLGDSKEELILEAAEEETFLDLSKPVRKTEKISRSSGNQYDSFFEN